jgi:hypothetical protein
LRFVESTRQKDVLDAYTAWKLKINNNYSLYFKKIIKIIKIIKKNNILKNNFIFYWLLLK